MSTVENKDFKLSKDRQLKFSRFKLHFSRYGFELVQLLALRFERSQMRNRTGVSDISEFKAMNAWNIDLNDQSI